MSSIVNQFKEVPTTCISDAMQGLNGLDPSIKPLKEEYKIAGRAFTVNLPANDNLMFLKAIKEAKPGDILVVDAKGHQYNAIAGDFVVGMAQTLGLGGIVVDGVIRDVAEIKSLNFPVFCKGTTVAASGKAGGGETGVPISCGGVTIYPGDIIVGDVDGVTVVPERMEQDVLKKALEKMAKDEERAGSILGNREAVINYIDRMLAKK
ncbi:RraA family protein [Laceyella putida]|uniref:Putative 4-hydroxy-4-methyl-2-oxoglutarate aldolase n=1 Tax=Laceyella putida TaxID=110101 RepID=A0ABW2RF39_9BACL